MDTNDADLYKEQLPNLSTHLLGTTKKICHPRTITRKFPILHWLPRYHISYLLSDLIAGFTVGLTTIPQAIAYGIVAGLEPQYGLYAAFMGCFTYIVFGSCKDVTIATTAIMAIMVHPYAVLSPDYAAFICFIVGCIILLLGLLNLGVLVQFISLPVITGFMLAAATTIGSAQINNLVGMKSPSNGFLVSWHYFFTHLTVISWSDAILGVCTLVLLLLLKKIKDFPYGSKVFWKYLSLARNALAVILGTILAYVLTTADGYHPFKVTGNITAGLPPFQLPPFSTQVNGSAISFHEMFQIVGVSFAAIPLVSILEIVAISKAFSKGRIVDASQEMVALGMCNIMGSFVCSMPVTGSFTRTAVNNASGVRTTLGGAMTGGLVLMALAFLTQTFYYIPKSTLAAIIIAAMISIAKVDEVADIWRSKKRDLFPFMATLLPCLFWSLEYGILCGVLANILYVLYKTARPQMTIANEKVNGHEVVIVHVQQSLDFAAAEFMRQKVIRYATNGNVLGRLILLRGENVTGIDYTVAMNIATLKEDLEILQYDLICWNWPIAAAGVVCRLRPTMRTIFKFNATAEQIITQYYDSISKSESEETICLGSFDDVDTTVATE